MLARLTLVGLLGGHTLVSKSRGCPPARELPMQALKLASYAPNTELTFLCEGMLSDPEVALEAVGTLLLMGEVDRKSVV